MPIVLKSGSLNLLEPSGPVQACNGIALSLSCLYWHTQRLVCRTSKETTTYIFSAFPFHSQRNGPVFLPFYDLHDPNVPSCLERGVPPAVNLLLPHTTSILFKGPKCMVTSLNIFLHKSVIPCRLIHHTFLILNLYTHHRLRTPGAM